MRRATSIGLALASFVAWEVIGITIAATRSWIVLKVYNKSYSVATMVTRHFTMALTVDARIALESIGTCIAGSIEMGIEDSRAAGIRKLCVGLEE